MDKRIYLLASIAFVVGMDELLIGGILDLVARDLGVSIRQAGLLITAFALVVGISGPVLLFLVGQADRKRVALATLSILIIGNFVAVFSTTYGTLMLSRVITAASGALLTVLSLALAPRISAPEYRGRAIGLVVRGSADRSFSGCRSGSPWATPTAGGARSFSSPCWPSSSPEASMPSSAASRPARRRL